MLTEMGGMIIIALVNGLCRPHGSTVPGEPSAHALPGLIHESSSSSGLEETSPSPAQHVDRSSKKGWGMPVSTAWNRAIDRRLWGCGHDGLKGSAG